MADSSHIDSIPSAGSPAQQPSLDDLIRTVGVAWGQIYWRKIALFGLSLFLFVLAITLMKEGAYDLGPLVRDRFTVTNAANSLGFG